MKFVKRISLFFILPAFLFVSGFLTNMAIEKFFYPGDMKSEAGQAEQVKTEKEKVKEELAVSAPDAQIMTADTEYIVVNYDMISGESTKQEETAPDKYIGLSREKLEEEIREYGESPSLTDLEKGFSHIELLSFSTDQVVVQKSYEKADGFYLVNEDNYVVVYDKDLKYLYMNTGILTEELPQALQQEIIQMKYIESEEELYHFLESYSS